MNWLSLQTVAQFSMERIFNALPEGILIALFAWVLLRILRRQNSGTRFAVWFLALLTVAALPLLNGFGEGRALAGTRIFSSLEWGNPRPAVTIPLEWAIFGFVAWALGACVAMARLAVGLWRLGQLRRSCVPVAVADLDPIVRKTVDEISAASGAAGPVAITTSECVRVPAAIGFWKRTIVLPAWALRELPAEDLNVILLHEFAHFRRWDDWTNLVQKIVRAVFFVHPAVWWIERELAVEREMACDDAVLAQTANPHGYATCLVSLLEKSLAHRLSQRRWSMVQAAVYRAREASLRLAQILDKNRPKATRVWKPAVGMVGVFSMVCLMAMPRAPQLVAFDREIPVNRSGLEYSAAVTRPAFGVQHAPGQTSAQARVIPAAFRSVDSQARAGKIAVLHGADERRPSAGRFVSATTHATLPRQQIVAASAALDQGMMPQFQTLVFIEATQCGSPESPVWSVQVWRVTLVTATRERIARMPVASSI
ncbi:MAG: M56 family metallopeptidase [Terriglobales bacterium]